MKKVIFIGSTSYSGSTFFDMTLGNDPRGFSCGEVYAYFNPTRPHHVAPPCTCGNPDCDVWPKVRKAGVEHVYEALFDHFPEVEFVVDSSKDPFWIAEQSERLRRQGIAVANMLIWKTPLELAYSYKKRDQLAEWERSWVVYHRLYHTLVDEWRAVQYREYAQNPDVLETICDYLEIPYFEGKARYWEKTHHILFGNDSARAHLAEAAIQAVEPLAADVRRRVKARKTYQTVYYRPVTDPELRAEVDRRVEASPEIQGLLTLLAARDVARHEAPLPERPELRLSPLNVNLRRLKQRARYRVGHYRYGRADQEPPTFTASHD